ncbi:MAG: dicarboxylate/amino acid:cation symporter [Candidatus Latescibacteria bacterium]|jgi:Na+/H+-dicarboxylate symporter|nr:dicarboxylate/amino acid:cation symporter [Candidatus Latescibacterota bacterium]
MASQNRFLLFILVAIVLGALFGGLYPNAALHVGFLGRLFLNALKMIVIPLVITSMVCGVANMGDVRRLGGVGKRTVLYYMATTGLSVLVGLVLVNIVRPGVDVQRGEDLAGVPYAVEGNRVQLDESARIPTDYDARYQVLLLDQDIAGIVDPMVPAGPDHLTVKGWRHRPTGEVQVPRASGSGLRIDLVVAEKVKGKDRGVLEVLVDVLVGMVPTNIFKAMAETDVLPVIAFSLLFGGILTTLGDRARPVLNVIAGLNEAIMKMVHIIIGFAPVGIFGLIADRMGQSGGWAGFLPELVKVGWYALTVISGLLIHGVITLPLVLLVVARRSIWRYTSNMLPALSTAFSTASSSATLPLTIECVEDRNRVSNRVSSFVLPLGATINMDGTALYEAVAAMFIAQAYGITMGPVEQVIIFLTATLAAIGAAGIPEAGLVTMVIVLRAVDLPVEGITLILVIDWFLDRCRTTVNVWGDAVGAAVVSRYEGDPEPVETSPATS